MPFDRLVVSTDDNPMFIEFWPLVVSAWQKFFPGKQITIAFVTDRGCNDPLVETMMERGADVVQVMTHPVIPSANLAKVARYIVAGQYGDEVCLIHDMDTIPLQRKYHEVLLARRRPGHMLCVGGEVYLGTPHEGKFPAGHMCGEGRLFWRLFGENVEDYIGCREIDDKESISNDPDKFSDESLIRALLRDVDIPTQHVERGLDIQRDWIDRSWWGFDIRKLWDRGYVECNMLRPWHRYISAMAPIVDYVCSDNDEGATC